jgi:hypothetical protein
VEYQAEALNLEKADLNGSDSRDRSSAGRAETFVNRKKEQTLTDFRQPTNLRHSIDAASRSPATKKRV